MSNSYNNFRDNQQMEIPFIQNSFIKPIIEGNNYSKPLFKTSDQTQVMFNDYDPNNLIINGDLSNTEYKQSFTKDTINGENMINSYFDNYKDYNNNQNSNIYQKILSDEELSKGIKFQIDLNKINKKKKYKKNNHLNKSNKNNTLSKKIKLILKYDKNNTDNIEISEDDEFFKHFNKTENFNNTRVYRNDSKNYHENKINLNKDPLKFKPILTLNPSRKPLYESIIKEVNEDKVVSPNIFFKWVKENAIKMKNLNFNISNKNNQNRIKCPDKISEDDTIITIPKELVIDQDTALSTKECGKIEGIEELKINSDKICMTIYLIINTNKKHETFINFLLANTKYKNIPFFYTKQERELIKGTYFDQLLSAKEQSIINEYKILTINGILAKNIDQHIYFKYRCTVMSKLLLVRRNTEKIILLAPVINLIPHDIRKKNVAIELDDNDNLVLKPDFDILPNNNLYMIYGKYANYYNLLFYGFSDSSNPYGIEIFLELNVEGQDLPLDEISITSGLKLNSALKKLRKTIQSFTSTRKDFNNPIYPISIENELEALRLLKYGLGKQLSLTSHALENLPTTGENIENILSVLKEEDGILRKFYKATRIFHNLLSRYKDNVREIVIQSNMENYIEDNRPFRHYVKLLKKYLDIRIVFEDNENSDDEDDDEEDEDGYDGSDYEKFRDKLSKRYPDEEIPDQNNDKKDKSDKNAGIVLDSHKADPVIKKEK